MKNFFVSVITFCIWISSFSQLPTRDGNLFYDLNGRPVPLTKYEHISEGTAFFKDSLMKGTAYMTGSREFRNLLLRINLLDNELHYKVGEEKEMISTGEVMEFSLFDTLTNERFHFVYSAYMPSDKKPEPAWYQQLHHGKVSLYKQHKKEIQDVALYGQGHKEKKIYTQYWYYLLHGKQWLQFKKIKEVVEILNDKKPQLQSFISLNKLNQDSETNFIKLITYYNSL